MNNYTPEQVLRILPSVCDREGFYDRGGTHEHRDRAEGMERVSTSVDIHAAMNPLCEVLDVETAYLSLDWPERNLLKDAATRPLSEMAAMYGDDWAKLVYASCCNLAGRA